MKTLSVYGFNFEHLMKPVVTQTIKTYAVLINLVQRLTVE